MTASERLRELEHDGRAKFTTATQDDWFVIAENVMDALPLIADVVEAAERQAAFDLYAMPHLPDMDARAIDYSDYSVLFKAQEAARAALTALSEALEEK